jgi:glycosyltransferase involved in cell wall biosynthesis
MEDNRQIHITHIITGLNVGGAEMMLLKLLWAVDLEKYPSRVISLTDNGVLGTRIESLGIPVTAMGMKPGRFSYRDIKQLSQEIKEQNPDVIQTWMYHADFIGGWAAKRAGVKGIAWNIRNSTLDVRKSKASTLAIVGMCALLSHYVPRRIVVCSQSASRVHQKIGYSANKMVVIPNGFDLDTFKPDPAAGTAFRRTLNLTGYTPVVGLAARFDEQKDHQTFIRSAAIVLKSSPQTHFLLCGDRITEDNQKLLQWVKETGFPANFHLLDRQSDIQTFHAACDVSVSSSAYGESFSNVLGEAMACGIPCVATNVGGAEEVLGDTGIIVPPRDPEALAKGIVKILTLPNDQRQLMGQHSRERILENFDINLISQTYMNFWKELVEKID